MEPGLSGANLIELSNFAGLVGVPYVRTREFFSNREASSFCPLWDPLSSLLFNTVLWKALEEDIPRWQKKKGVGIYLSDNDHDCLTNMRFADDVLLFASSIEQLQQMLCEFKGSTEKVGLRIHPEKTKILGNQSLNIRKEIEIDELKVEILTLGQMITFQQQESTEIRNRIRAAWRRSTSTDRR